MCAVNLCEYVQRKYKLIFIYSIYLHIFYIHTHTRVEYTINFSNSCDEIMTNNNKIWK